MSRRALVCGAGGFIGGHLVGELLKRGDLVVACDIKPINEWWQVHTDAENFNADLRNWTDCVDMVARAQDVYQLAADMGGIAFIEHNRIDCMRSVLINVNMLEAAYLAGVERFFYSSSACVYNADKQSRPDVTALAENDAYPAMAERGYGWEKLYSEMLCQEYAAAGKLKTFIARFHNVYGPHGTWRGGREKAPAALCRKVAEAMLGGQEEIEIWGDGQQTRSFMWIGDCIDGILRIINEPQLIAVPINLGSSYLVSIDALALMICQIAGLRTIRLKHVGGPLGVRGRNSDNTQIKALLGWEPDTPLYSGLCETFLWVKNQIKREMTYDSARS